MKGATIPVMKERTMFAQEFLKHRKKVASPTPTSDSSAIKICSFVPYSPDNKIVEYGPGTGAITKYLINKLGNESQLVLIEENRRFCNTLENRFGNDPKISIFNKPAENVKSILEKLAISEIDYIVSGIPFTFLSPEQIDVILQTSRDFLASDGQFIAYQIKDSIMTHLEKYFRNVESEKIHHSPLTIYRAWN